MYMSGLMKKDEKLYGRKKITEHVYRLIFRDIICGMTKSCTCRKKYGNIFWDQPPQIEALSKNLPRQRSQLLPRQPFDVPCSRWNIFVDQPPFSFIDITSIRTHHMMFWSFPRKDALIGKFMLTDRFQKSPNTLVNNFFRWSRLDEALCPLY